jgi:hypothetical protein
MQVDVHLQVDQRMAIELNLDVNEVNLIRQPIIAPLYIADRLDHAELVELDARSSWTIPRRKRLTRPRLTSSDDENEDYLFSTFFETRVVSYVHLPFHRFQYSSPAPKSTVHLLSPISQRRQTLMETLSNMARKCIGGKKKDIDLAGGEQAVGQVQPVQVISTIDSQWTLRIHPSINTNTLPCKTSNSPPPFMALLLKMMFIYRWLAKSICLLNRLL